MAGSADTSILALDIGTQRTGVAKANLLLRLPSTLTVLAPDALADDVALLVAEHQAVAVVIGLPRSLNGDETPQTAYVREVAKAIEAQLDASVPIYFTDEALTSVKAEEELTARGKHFEKGDIDMLSAVYILEDFLNSKEGRDV